MIKTQYFCNIMLLQNRGNRHKQVDFYPEFLKCEYTTLKIVAVNIILHEKLSPILIKGLQLSRTISSLPSAALLRTAFYLSTFICVSY